MDAIAAEELVTGFADEFEWADCGGGNDDEIAGPTELVGPNGGFNLGWYKKFLNLNSEMTGVAVVAW